MNNDDLYIMRSQIELKIKPEKKDAICTTKSSKSVCSNQNTMDKVLSEKKSTIEAIKTQQSQAESDIKFRDDCLAASKMNLNN